MRYDKQITFVKLGDKTYDASTGDYIFAGPTKTVVPAAVLDTRAETLTLVYGKLVEGSLTIQIQNAFLDAFDFIEYNGKKYRVDFMRKLRVKETFVVSEVQ
jgi:hypothetical protein